MKRAICVVTGTRAEYGLLRWVMEGVRDSSALELQVVATGMHLSEAFGLTYREIERDGITIDEKIDVELASGMPQDLARSMGLGLIGFGETLQRLGPDLLLVLGDRFEIFPAVAAALVAGIPVAHIHGGETTEGAFDEAIRHAITKMSHLHFVATEEYRRRVIQLGEDPSRVFLVGGLGVDSIRRLRLLGRAELEAELGVALGAKSLLVTFHPVTLEVGTSRKQMAELLAALDALPDTTLIFTMPNADTGGRALFDMVEEYARNRANAKAFVSLGQVGYLSCMREVDGVVGNSSSGLLEAASFRRGTVNIGDRQKGRLQAGNVINCEPERQAILSAIARLYSDSFRSGLNTVRNPYGEGGASEKIVAILESYPLNGVLKKSFHDLAQ